MKTTKLLSILLSVMLALFFLTGSVAFAILYRPFYYHQIAALKLPEQTGWSEQTIREAYDDVMDYLVFDAPFRAGTLHWSQSGKEHFTDCKKLFRLDFALLSVSALALIGLLVLHKRKIILFHHFVGRTPAFWAAVCMIVVFTIVLLWAMIDFNHLFTAFHTTFFAGKTNWIFDARYDQIIRILPEQFWMRVSGFVLLLCIGGVTVCAAISEYLQRKVHR